MAMATLGKTSKDPNIHFICVQTLTIIADIEEYVRYMLQENCLDIITLVLKHPVLKFTLLGLKALVRYACLCLNE